VLEPRAGLAEERREVPQDVVRHLRDLGYFGLTIPSEFGGVGLGLTEYLEVVIELAATNLAFQEQIEENNGIGSSALVIAGSEEQKQRWLPRLASGEVVAAFALTESSAGSDAAAIRTTARRVAGGYVIDGRKHFITHGADAGLITVVARTVDIDGAATGHGLFLVTPDAPGFAVARVQPMMGYRATRHAELVFDEVFVADDDALGSPNDGFAIAMQTLDRGRLTVAADCLGLARRLLERTIDYVRLRTTFGRPLAERGQVRGMLARSAIDLFLIESELFDFARRVDAGEELRWASARLKLFASEAAGRVADQAMQLHGGFGYTVEAQIERGYRDIRVMRIAEGASELLRSIIARGFLRNVDSYRETTP
jgi:acyl-CoA dehydrogenase